MTSEELTNALLWAFGIVAVFGAVAVLLLIDYFDRKFEERARQEFPFLDWGDDK